MSLIVKICGLSTEETVDAALAAGADMVGFVFFPRSPRFVPIDRAAALAARARGRAAVVALAVDMDDAGLAGIVAAVEPDWLQLERRFKEHIDPRQDHRTRSHTGYAFPHPYPGLSPSILHRHGKQSHAQFAPNCDIWPAALLRHLAHKAIHTLRLRMH